MADGYLNFDTKINEKGFEKGIGNINSSLKGVRSSLVKIGALVATAFSVKAIAGFARESENLYNTQIEQEVKLETVMRQRMKATDESIQSIKDYASQLQQAGVIGDEVQLAGAQQIATFLNEADSLKTLMPAMNNLLAQQRGLEASTGDAVNVANLMGKVMQGQTSALTRVGISFSEAEEQVLKFGDESQRAAMLAQVITNNVGDMNAALANTTAGRQQQLANTVGDVKEQFGAAVSNLKSAFIPALQVGVDLLSKLAATAKQVSEVFAGLFGIDPAGSAAASSAVLADSAASAAGSYEDIAGSAETAAKASEKTLAGFDKVTKLGSQESSANEGQTGAVSSLMGSTASLKVDADTSAAAKKLDKLKETFAAIVDPFVKAWKSKGEDTVKSVTNAFQGLKELAVSVGKSFAEVWKSGSGQEATEHILGIISGRLNTVGNLAHNLSDAWESDSLGTNIVQNAADALNTYLGHLENISSATADWASTVDFKPLLSGLEKLTSALEPLSDAVGQGLEDFYKEVLLPLGSWTIEDLIPQFLESLTDVIDGLTTVWNTAYPVVKEKLWDEFLKPIASWTAGAALTALDSLSSGFKNVCESISEKDVAVLLDLAGAIAAVYAAVKGKKALDAFAVSLGNLSSNAGTFVGQLRKVATTDVTKPASEGGATFATKFMSVVGSFFVGWEIGSMLRDAIGPDKIDAILYPVFDGVVAAWNGIVDFFTVSIPGFFGNFSSNWISGFQSIWSDTKEVFSDLGSWFSEKASDIVSAFSGLGQALNQKAADARAAIASVFVDIGSWFIARKNDIVNAFAGLGQWFGALFTNAWASIKNAFSTVGSFFGSVWENIKKPFSAISSWFQEKFSAAWTAVKNVFSTGGKIFDGIKEGILEGLKAVVNAIITGINKVISLPFEGINTALEKIKNIDILGFTPFDWINTIDVPQIPKLATGTVVPKNYGEFMAILGDNKREPEVVSPESTIVSAVKRALNEMGGGNGGDIYITMTLDGDVVYKTVVRKNKENTIRTGKNPLAT